MRALAIILTAALGVYCDPSTASEAFLIFTAQLYSYLCNNNAIFSYIDNREVLQQEYSQPPILPSPHFRWVVNLLFVGRGCEAHFTTTAFEFNENSGNLEVFDQNLEENHSNFLLTF